MHRASKYSLYALVLFAIPFSVGVLALIDATKTMFSPGWRIVAYLIMLLVTPAFLASAMAFVGILGWLRGSVELNRRIVECRPARATILSCAAAMALVSASVAWAPLLPPRPPPNPAKRVADSSCNTIWVLADYEGRCSAWSNPPDPYATERQWSLAMSLLGLSLAAGVAASAFRPAKVRGA